MKGPLPLMFIIGVLCPNRSHAWEFQPAPSDKGLHGKQPVHELITSEAATAICRAAPGNPLCAPPGMSMLEGNCRASLGLCRGIIWNDDPLAYAFEPGNESVFRRKRNWYAVGVIRVWDGRANDYRMNKNRPDSLGVGLGHELFQRTHWGDLAFLHAMRATSKERPEETRRKVLMWARFVLGVWSGRIPRGTRLKDVVVDGAPLAGLELLSKDSEKNWNGCQNAEKRDEEACDFGDWRNHPKPLQDTTVEELLCFPSRHCDGYQGRAMGSLLHMVQDSYSPAHTDRPKMGPITEYFFYLVQGACHGLIDSADPEQVWPTFTSPLPFRCGEKAREMRSWREPPKRSWRIRPDLERGRREFPGYAAAIATSRRLMELSTRNDPAPILHYLEDSVFQLHVPPPPGSTARAAAQAVRAVRDRVKSLSKLREKLDNLRERLKEAQLEGKRARLSEGIRVLPGCEVSLSDKDRSLRIKCKDEVLFDRGKSELKAGATRSLKQVARALRTSGLLESLRNSNRKLQVVGHADENKKSVNWDLSVKRAAEVVKHLAEEDGKEALSDGKVPPDVLSA